MAGNIRIIRSLFEAALAATWSDGNLPDQPSGRTIVLGASKAAARMAVRCLYEVVDSANLVHHLPPFCSDTAALRPGRVHKAAFA